MIVELGYRKISWFVSVLPINDIIIICLSLRLQQIIIIWSAQLCQIMIFCSTSVSNIIVNYWYGSEVKVWGTLCDSYLNHLASNYLQSWRYLWNLMAIGEKVLTSDHWPWSVKQIIIDDVATCGCDQTKNTLGQHKEGRLNEPPNFYTCYVCVLPSEKGE